MQASSLPRVHSNSLLMDRMDNAHYVEVIRTSLIAKTIEAEPLIALIPSFSPPQLEAIRISLLFIYDLSVGDLVPEGSRSSFRDTVRAVLLGPLGFDHWLLERAMRGSKMNITFLNMVLLDRENSDLDAIKAVYARWFTYPEAVLYFVGRKLSGDVKLLYKIVLTEPRSSAPPVGSVVEEDANSLYYALAGEPDGGKVARILATRSYPHLLEVVEEYKGISKKTLDETIKKKFDGDMRDALLYILRGVTNRALRDAKLLEGAMAGAGITSLPVPFPLSQSSIHTNTRKGTKKEELSYRLVILHWNQAHMKAVCETYYNVSNTEVRKRRTVAARIKGEKSLSDRHKGLLLALLDPQPLK